METLLSLFFMLFGLGFFIFVTDIVRRDQRQVERQEREAKREAWERRIMEAREFGFGGKNQHTAQTLHEGEK